MPNASLGIKVPSFNLMVLLRMDIALDADGEIGDTVQSIRVRLCPLPRMCRDGFYRG